MIDYGESQLRLSCAATLDRPKPMRHALSSFMTALDIQEETRDDILTAVGEALANAVEHAHEPGVTGTVSMSARLESPATMLIEVADDGQFVERTEPREFRGFGLRIMSAIAREMEVEADGGTRISLRFAIS